MKAPLRTDQHSALGQLARGLSPGPLVELVQCLMKVDIPGIVQGVLGECTPQDVKALR